MTLQNQMMNSIGRTVRYHSSPERAGSSLAPIFVTSTISRLRLFVSERHPVFCKREEVLRQWPVLQCVTRCLLMTRCVVVGWELQLGESGHPGADRITAASHGRQHRDAERLRIQRLRSGSQRLSGRHPLRRHHASPNCPAPVPTTTEPTSGQPLHFQHAPSASCRRRINIR